MNRKLATIQLLKQKINDMQGRLNKLQNQADLQEKASKSKSRNKSQLQSKSPNRNTSSNPRYKSPTFWGGNPILGQSNKYRTQQRSHSPTFKQIRKSSIASMSPLTLKIKNDVDEKFYQSATIQSKVAQQENNPPLKTANFGKRFQHRFFEHRRDNYKTQKIKTYQKGLRDPILNPQPSRPIGRKILHRQQYSPEKMQNHYTQNASSNPNVYFNATTKAQMNLNLSPKHQTKRNKSPDIKLLLSSSAQNLSNYESKKSSKKHFSRYFQENIASKWSTNW